jgi:hypothetical protein
MEKLRSRSILSKTMLYFYANSKDGGSSKGLLNLISICYRPLTKIIFLALFVLLLLYRPLTKNIFSHDL